MGKTDPRDFYKEEASELLNNIETYLLDLEENPEDDDLINNVFRALHTIKGSGSMFGFDHIASFTHDVETMFDLIRSGKLKVTKEAIDVTLEARDHIRLLLTNEDTLPSDFDIKTEEILLTSLRTLSNKKPEEKKKKTEEAETENDYGPERTFRILFQPHESIFLTGTNPLLLFKELKVLGDCLIFADTSRIPTAEDLNPELCYSKWTILVTTAADINAIKDVFIFVEDTSKIKIDIIDEGNIDAETDYKKIGEILFDQGSIDEQEIKQILTRRDRFGEIALNEGVLSEGDLQAALEEQKYVRELRKKRQDTTISSTIRVKNEKLDNLVDLVGELVTLQARLSQYSDSDETDPELQTISETLERLTSELRDNTMNIRMVPLAETFRSFYRLVRDLSNDLGKEIDLITTGAETELDKNIIDQLKDPLVHIIRNAVDHGIETPAERIKNGKPERGRITIEASHSGANVLITIKDNGFGLNAEKIRNRAEERGLIEKNSVISREELLSLIFEPGFSTAEKATSVSGRGVGMDVVKKNIERLRGTVEVESTVNEGTSFILSIPLTLSIIDGLLVQVGNDKYIMNLSYVDECFDLTDSILHGAEGNNLVKIREDLVPFIRVREMFEYEGNYEGITQLVVVTIENTKVGIVVDNILGQYQTVIKPLSSAFKQVEEVSGSTILGDGTISLILDLNKIVKKVESVKKKNQKEIAV